MGLGGECSWFPCVSPEYLIRPMSCGRTGDDGAVVASNRPSVSSFRYSWGFPLRVVLVPEADHQISSASADRW